MKKKWAANVEGLANTVKENWYLGFTSFGGPPVHFKIFHDKFVTKLGWIDEQVYQELFSVCQAFSGPGSTKMHYCINLIHSGFISAVLSFLIWSLPGALGMFGLAIGISNIGDSLPRPVYALLSGLNAATVGIIALAAVQLAQKAITDKLTRSLVFLGAAAGLLYNALWYFPLLMFIAGIISVVHDFKWLHGPIKRVFGVFSGAGRARGRRMSRQEDDQQPREGSSSAHGVITATATAASGTGSRSSDGFELSQRETGRRHDADDEEDITTAPPHNAPDEKTPQKPSSAESEPRVVPSSHNLSQPSSQKQINTPTWKIGLTIIILFFLSFLAVMLLRGLLPDTMRPLLYRLFANMYLAGTIIFGGGPVVIPLLREYVVAEGWVSPRDFLIGLALIQGFPGPNFNFAVYLGGLTAINYYRGDNNSGGAGELSVASAGVVGALLGYAGIFLPGLVTVHGTMGIWNAIRSWRWVKSALRGINAAAVGLIYTAVYRLWQIGWIDEGFQQGTSLANDPWWVVVTATSYVGGCWYGVSPPVACFVGAALGLVRYGVVVGQGY
ncbi:chromate transporter-domain-containing protein [Rhypophila decipiens]|uniref:Chromate transporter-domain-containing protein n=1 Tax=Rhypophila decipiens TaxID=261697 RepID=A0AAN7BF30_9PEZI|nr:chromate transporter-domain-containing protein [Rhypophila decipiens]